MNYKDKSSRTALVVAETAIFTALVFVATTIIRVPIPATGGYFNVGDSIIYAAAILFGPFVGGVAGGVGAAVADVVGYPIFAPGTLIIKFLEGAITGYASRFYPKKKSRAFWRTLSALLGISLGTTAFFIGSNYMAVLGNEIFDQIIWAALAVFLALFIISASFHSTPETSWQTIAIITGGVVMMAGYFLFESLLAILIPSLKIYAIAEIPANIGQMLVGLIIALPALQVAKRAFPEKQK